MEFDCVFEHGRLVLHICKTLHSNSLGTGSRMYIHKQSELIVCFSVVHGLEKEDFFENFYILSCFGQLKSVLFNLLCVLEEFTCLNPDSPPHTSDPLV